MTKSTSATGDWIWHLSSTSFLAQLLVEPRTYSSTSMPFPGFEPGTSGTAAGFPNHCSIWSANWLRCAFCFLGNRSLCIWWRKACPFGTGWAIFFYLWYIKMFFYFCLYINHHFIYLLCYVILICNLNRNTNFFFFFTETFLVSYFNTCSISLYTYTLEFKKNLWFFVIVKIY